VKLIKEELHKFAGRKPKSAQKLPLTSTVILDEIGTRFYGVNLCADWLVRAYRILYMVSCYIYGMSTCVHKLLGLI